MIQDLIVVITGDNTRSRVASVKKSDILRQVFENNDIDTTSGIFSINGVNIHNDILNKTFDEVLALTDSIDFSKPIWLTKVDKRLIKITFTLEQIEELKYITEDSGVNDVISYIDEIAEPQFEGYQCGRVIY